MHLFDNSDNIQVLIIYRMTMPILDQGYGGWVIKIDQFKGRDVYLQG